MHKAVNKTVSKTGACGMLRRTDLRRTLGDKWMEPKQRFMYDLKTGQKTTKFVYDFPLDEQLQRHISNVPQVAIHTLCATNLCIMICRA